MSRRLVHDLPGATTTNVVPPGGRAQFSILWISSGLMLPGTCVGRRTDPPYQLHIQVPGDATPLVLDLSSVNPCDYEVGVLPVGVFGGDSSGRGRCRQIHQRPTNGRISGT